MKRILSYFGYIKIPIEAVQLSIEQESIFEKLRELQTIPKAKELFKQRLEMQKTLTRFLRSGRL